MVRREIIKYQNKKVYATKRIVKYKANKKKETDYYQKSLHGLIEYMKKNEKNPSESVWNRFAIANRYLASKSMGYLSGTGFNRLCKNIRKKLNKMKNRR